MFARLRANIDHCGLRFSYSDIKVEKYEYFLVIFFLILFVYTISYA